MDWNTLIIGALIGAFVTIPFSIFGNIATPWVKSYFEQRSLTIRERKIYILISRYKLIKLYKEHPAYLNLFVVQKLSIGLVFLAILIGLTNIEVWYSVDAIIKAHYDYSLTGNVFMVIIGVSYMLFFHREMLITLNEVIRFGRYKQETIQKLINLGGNPEELDKIDKEFEETEEVKKPVKTRRG